MKITEIIQLLKAGYTKAEIAELKDAETIVDLPAHTEPTEPEPDTSPAPVGPDPEIAELKNMVQNLTKLMQAQNLKNNVRESAPAEDSAVDILASVIGGSKNPNT